MKDRPFRILSLSGGGIRGIFQAVYLARLSEHFSSRDDPVPLFNYFDLVCGTSTGALVALAVAMGLEPNEIVDAYRKNGKSIFKHRILGPLRKGGRYNPCPFRKILADIFECKALCDAKIDIIITATSIDDFGHKIFTTLERRDDPDCKNLFAADIVAASASAPTFFPPTKPNKSERAFVDGGLWANSPATVGILTAHRLKNIPFKSMRLLTVGTGKLPGGTTLEKFSRLRKLSVSTIDLIFELMFSAQESFADENARLLLPPENVINANVVLENEIALDDFNAALAWLPPLAEKEADRTKDQFRDLFVSPASNEQPIVATKNVRSPAINHLVSRDVIKSAGLTGFYPSRESYGSQRRNGESISTYIGSAKKTIGMISINLMTGLSFDGLTKTLKNKLMGKEPTSMEILISLLDPREPSLMAALSPALGKNQQQLSDMIYESLGNIYKLYDSLPEYCRERLQIRVHKTIPFGSLILLDVDEPDGRIQIETKPYKVPNKESFGFEVMRTDEEGLYESLREGYLSLIADGDDIIPWLISNKISS